jgi:PLP dependent protein
VPPAQDGDRRRAELVTALGGIRARIAAACDDAGRNPRGVTLIAVTKTYPAGDVVALAELGVLDIGESKDQEARAKVAELAGDGARLGIRWHLIGRLQTNKVRSVVAYAHAVHTVDRPKLARALADAWPAHRADPLDVFVQISLDGDPERGGVPVERFDELVDVVAQRPQLRLRGVMAVPPLGTDADREFERLQALSARLRERHPGADAISAGMSADLDAAIRRGSTHVRVGTALLGRREQVFG